MNIRPKQFLFNILNGMATGIVVALIPNAMLGELFKFLAQYYSIFGVFVQYLTIFQFCAALYIGMLVGHQFKMSGANAAIIAGAAFIGSGAVQFTDKGISLVGLGDLLNMMLTIAISVLVLLWIGDRLGSLSIVILPIVGGIIPGMLGTLTLPYVRLVTGALGHMVETFTTLNPLLMCILICMTYALLMATPISLVAIATVIGLSGLGSGAANLGIAACCYTFIVGSLFVNDKGTNTTLIIGAAKMMMPVYVKHPLIMIPLALNGIVGGLMAYFFNIQGTPMSAGFGYTGLVGPLNAFRFMEGDIGWRVLQLLIAYFLIPVPLSFAIHFVLKKLIPGYKNNIYTFKPNIN